MTRCELLVVTALLGGVASCHSEASITLSDAAIERAIVEACRSLVTEYAIARDRPNPDAYANTFARDGTLELPDQIFEGRNQIRDRLLASAQTSRSRHFMSTTQINVLSNRRATGIAYAVIYVEPLSATDDAASLPTSGPRAIGEYHDEFELTDEGWKFRSRKFVPIFSQPSHQE